MWTAIQYAMQGRSHIHDNTPCQDKTYAITTNDTTVVALADGAGSAVQSHLGADNATKTICSYLAGNFDLLYNTPDGRIVKQELLSVVLDSLKELAQKSSCALHDLASTLLVVAIHESRYIILHIGDGVIGYTDNDILRVASTPENGEFANQTFFTTSADSLNSMKLFKGEIGSKDSFILMSDGTESGFYNKREKRLASFLLDVIRSFRIGKTDIVECLFQQNFNSLFPKITGDDCSIVFLIKDTSYFSFNSLCFDDKVSFLKLSPKATPRQIKKYDMVLNSLQTPHSLRDLSRTIHLREKYTYRILVRLEELKYVYKASNKYYTILKP